MNVQPTLSSSVFLSLDAILQGHYVRKWKYESLDGYSSLSWRNIAISPRELASIKCQTDVDITRSLTEELFRLACMKQRFSHLMGIKLNLNNYLLNPYLDLFLSASHVIPISTHAPSPP